MRIFFSVSRTVFRYILASSIRASIGRSVGLSATRFYPNSRNRLFPTWTMDKKWGGAETHTCTLTNTMTHTLTHTNARPIVGWNCMKLMHSIHRQSEWMGERANGWMSAAVSSEKKANECAVWVNKQVKELMVQYFLRHFHNHSTHCAMCSRLAEPQWRRIAKHTHARTHIHTHTHTRGQN